jgi:CubicO group peptidase (beta-lactamase class C family)
MAYSILAFALENITGNAFNSTFQSAIIEPLGLSSTYLSPPSNISHAFVPYNLSYSGFLWDTYDEAPAAGYYFSIADLRTPGRAILDSTLLPPSITRRWLKPVSFTGSPNVSVGAPSKTLCAPLVSERTSWMYTKGGHYGQFISARLLLPDWDIGYTVHANEQQVSLAVNTVSNIVAEVVVAVALEAAAATEANATYAVTYESMNRDSIIITVEE